MLVLPNYFLRLWGFWIAFIAPAYSLNIEILNYAFLLLSKTQNWNEECNKEANWNTNIIQTKAKLVCVCVCLCVWMAGTQAAKKGAGMGCGVGNAMWQFGKTLRANLLSKQKPKDPSRPHTRSKKGASFKISALKSSLGNGKPGAWQAVGQRGFEGGASGCQLFN